MRTLQLKHLVDKGLKLLMRTRRESAAPKLAELMESARGIFDSGVADLGSNPQHLQGFGRKIRRRA